LIIESVSMQVEYLAISLVMNLPGNQGSCKEALRLTLGASRLIGNLVVRYESQVIWSSRMDTACDLTTGTYMTRKNDGLAIHYKDQIVWDCTISGSEPSKEFGLSSCVNEGEVLDTVLLVIPMRTRLGRGHFYCLQGKTHRFGITEDGILRYFDNTRAEMEATKCQKQHDWCHPVKFYSRWDFGFMVLR
jgi:hypothetical protein